MLKKNKFLFVFLFFVFLILISLSFFSAGILDFISSVIKASESSDGANCGMRMGNYSSCMLMNSSCRWMNNSNVIPSYSYCPINYTNYNSTSVSMWFGNQSISFNTLTGGSIINAGCCEFKSGSGGSGSMGCMRFSGNKSGCGNSSLYGITGCSWKPNDLNQNSMCPIKKIGDWGPNGVINSISDVGCCENQGCWAFKGNQTSTNNCTTALGGACVYSSYGAGCSESGGCCGPKACSEVGSQTLCEQLIQIGSPCSWNGSACNMMGGGGFGMYNSTDSCMIKGGWWNGTGCQMPGSGSSGGGGFMFAQEAKCWFADNKISVCRNVSGCVYCSNSVTQLTNASSACYNAPSGSCKGHENLYTNWNGTASINVTDINRSSMTCDDLRTKRICNCGPLPNCIWNNGSADVGAYCISGMKSDSDKQSCNPPAMFCEDISSKNNQTLCNLLASDYMMPCKWDNVTNCSFNNIAVFGGGGGSGSTVNYNVISNEISCVAAGGTWTTSYYEDNDGSFKQDAWCDKGAMFSFSTGQAFANKGNCNSDCWACEFNSTGGAWPNAQNASAACLGSAKGVCRFKSDTTAPNRFGWCDYPKEMEYGSSGNCNSDCKSCELIGTNATTAEVACFASTLGCTWINDTAATRGGFCISSSKKSCLNDCNSCYSQVTCSNSSYHPSVNCSWDNSFKFCKTFGFTGEICFNGIDDDNDGKMDCGDSDCSYDQFCGGASTGSGGVDCKKFTAQGPCRGNVSASGLNCTWVNMSAGGMIGQSYCDFPGSDCWMYETDISLCQKSLRGCIFRNATGGYPLGPGGVSIPFKAFSGFCDINKTKSSTCYNSTNRINATLCNATSDCVWIADNYMVAGGRCEFMPYAICGSAFNSSDCNSGTTLMGIPRANKCAWRNNSMSSSGGFCEPTCAGKNSTACTGFCAWKSTTCEPEAFGGMETGGSGAGGVGGGFGCHINDGNQTSCLLQNMSCSWNSFSQNSSTGICMPKGEYSMISGMDQSPPKMLGIDVANDTSIKEIDIRQYGMKEAPTSLSFGIMVTNITDAAVCKGYYIGGMRGSGMGTGVLGNGSTTTKFFWYLDTNKNITDGCNATTQTGVNLTGFEFFMKYVVSLDNQTVSEQKSLYKCVSGEWVLTNVPLTSNRQMLCSSVMPNNFLGGVMMMVDKENLKSFVEYNQTAPVRVFVASSNASYSELNPQDSASVGYYTPGSADFKFVDCSNPNTKDSKCKNFQKFGFNIFEDCKNNKDDDSDGLTDCADAKCKFVPSCASGTAFNFVPDANDNQAPTVTFTQVDTLRDSAFVKFDTDEPANGTLNFYYNDSSCNSINTTINDLGDPSISYDNYKPFHIASLDLNNLGYSLTNGTVYYFKTTVCDPSNNCADSSCQNFTTSNEALKNFIFRMDLPDGCNVSIPALNYSGNFTKVVGGVLFDVGIKTNTSVSKNINITVTCCGNQSFTFVGADILKPKSIDMSTAFICNSTNKTLGMNSSSKSWNQLIGDIGMGGQSDYIKLTYPIDYSSSNNITWCDDALSNCTGVNNYASCSSGGSGKTDCKIPTSLGFSAYQMIVASTPSPTTTTTTTTSGSSGSGAAGGTAGSTAMTYVVNNNDLKIGYNKKISKGDRFKLNVSNAVHYVALDKVTSSSVSVNVTSTLQQALIKIGEEEKFEVTGDGVYDISVRANSIDLTGNVSKATLTVKSIEEKISQNLATGNVISNESSGAGSNVGSNAGGETSAETGKSKVNLSLILIVVGVIIVILVIVIIFSRVFKKTKKTEKYVVLKRN